MLLFLMLFCVTVVSFNVVGRGGLLVRVLCLYLANSKVQIDEIHVDCPHKMMIPNLIRDMYVPFTVRKAFFEIGDLQ
ncbi:hypothetical protein EV127DRAFT_428858 [Xylaria flabelliformis]|nr:hypothetical protein EV127DRAFT_428858 [Xylaria flabelliformis]